MSDQPAAAEGAKSGGKKKLLFIVGGAVVVLALVAGGAYFYISKQRAAADEEGGDEPAATASAHEATPPSYLPMDNMVVNLADPGGERVAQVGITLVVVDAHAAETVKAFLPTIRSGVLMLISKRTAEELLKPEGKEQLKADILHEASLPFGGDEAPAPEEGAKKKSKKKKASQHELPVSDVLFSSFIVQ